MSTIEISSWVFFGVLEISVVLLVTTLFFIFRGKLLSSRIARLQQKITELSQPVPETNVHGFKEYLRDEILRNQDLLERPENEELFAMRKQFLEIELQARELKDNPLAFEESLTGGFRGLIEQWRPEAAVEVNADVEPADTEPTDDLDIEISDGEQDREAIDTSGEELDRLKEVINNQQDAMAALREELHQREHEIDDVGSILKKLDEFERQSAELHTCLAVLEQENERLKSARESGAAPEDDGKDDMPLTGLKVMVNEQQETISKLHSLISELAPDANKARELENAMEDIERANRELSGCVSVLEDENAMLRNELEQMFVQVEQKSQGDDVGEAAGDTAIPVDMSSGDDARRELEEKVQELEALIEFKDAAIEELEKQYNSLEARYLTLTGEQQVG